MPRFREIIPYVEMRGWHAEQIDHTREIAPQIAAVLTRHGVM